MPPSSIRTHISQSANIVAHHPAQIVLNGHGRQLRVQIEHLLVGERADARRWMDVKPGHQFR